MIQKWTRIKWYSEDFLNLVYRYYAQHGIAYICTYYHLDLTNSICDKDILDAASYEDIGDWSGLVWEKILMVPMYNTEQVSINFFADERGFTKSEQKTSFNFPTLYGIIPTSKDFVVFEEVVLNKNYSSTQVPVFQVVNQERATNTWFDFWRVNMDVSHWEKSQLDQQVRETFIFIDYEKQIYPATIGQVLYSNMQKNTNVKLNDFYRHDIGVYFGT